MQQAARVSQKTAFFHLGNLVEFGETTRYLPRQKTHAQKAISPEGLDKPMVNRHTASAFDRDLEGVQAQIMKMVGLVEEAIRLGAQSLETRDEDLATKVRADDKAIDALEDAINERATCVISLRAPTAIDLRLILSVIKISANLERIGDPDPFDGRPRLQYRVYGSPFRRQKCGAHG